MFTNKKVFIAGLSLAYILSSSALAADKVFIDKKNDSINSLYQLGSEYQFTNANVTKLPNGKVLYKLAEYFKSVQVWDTAIVSRKADFNKEASQNDVIGGSFIMNIEKDLNNVTPVIDEQHAIEIAKSRYETNKFAAQEPDPDAKANLYVRNTDNKAELVWVVDFLKDKNTSRPFTIINANSGVIIDSWSGLAPKDALDPSNPDKKNDKYAHSPHYDPIEFDNHCPINNPPYASLITQVNNPEIFDRESGRKFTKENSGLLYTNQSGAINESFSDIAEAAKLYVDNEDSSITKCLQVMRFEDPTADGFSISHARDYITNMDVYYSSGIFKRAFYLLAHKPGWTTKKAFDTFVAANQLYWTQESNFESGASGVYNAARDLEYNVNDVQEIFDTVGIRIKCYAHHSTFML